MILPFGLDQNSWAQIKKINIFNIVNITYLREPFLGGDIFESDNADNDFFEFW